MSNERRLLALLISFSMAFVLLAFAPVTVRAQTQCTVSGTDQFVIIEDVGGVLTCTTSNVSGPSLAGKFVIYTHQGEHAGLGFRDQSGGSSSGEAPTCSLVGGGTLLQFQSSCIIRKMVDGVSIVSFAHSSLSNFGVLIFQHKAGFGASSVGTIRATHLDHTSAGSPQSTPAEASAGCFGNDLGAASTEMSDHNNWAERQSSETLRQNLSTKTHQVFDCSSMSRQNLNGLFSVLSYLVGEAVPDPACFSGDIGAASKIHSAHHRWAQGQTRDTLRDNIVWKISQVFSCLDRPLQTQFFGKASLVLAISQKTGEWIDTHSYGDWSGEDFACSSGIKPNEKYCDPSRTGVVAICWRPEDNQIGYPFEECKGYTSWCTYKSVNLSREQTGSNSGRVYICSAN